MMPLNFPTDQTGKALSASPHSTAGLSDQEVRDRQGLEGPNSLPPTGGKNLSRIIWSAMAQPMFLLLLATAGIYALLGSLSDAGMLLLSVLVVGGLSIYQEYRTERVLKALKNLSSPRCTVVRQGRALRIASEELVRGDRLIVNEGDRMAADAVLIEGMGIQMDESLLTGESEPVDKAARGAEVGVSHSNANDSSELHAGSLVVQGDGIAEVTAIGSKTALGRMGGTLVHLTPRTSRLQQELKYLVHRVAVMALITCLLAATLYAMRDGSWTNGLLVGLTLAMSLIPEEFAVVWSVMLALGAWRLAKHHVLTRQPQAIEALGTVTVMCVDKTGTLTCNRMALVCAHDGRDALQLSDKAPLTDRTRHVLRSAALSSVPHGIEPMDRAIFEAVGDESRALSDYIAGPRSGVRPGRPYVVHWWHAPEKPGFIAHVKGAPEAVLALCINPMDELAGLAAQARAWSASGLRVLAVAKGQAIEAPADGSLPTGTGLEALGLLGFMDPLRAEATQAVTECKSAGMRVVMITGDSPLTAANIGRQVGLADAMPLVMTGQELSGLSDAQLHQIVRDVAIFARVDPAQKMRIVRALQDQGEVVAMTGDGVNDAPALRAADIGVAMGQRGTDVAREAASLVLLDDNFASLVAATRAGRRIFMNLQKSLGYLFAVHVPIVGIALLPILTGGPVLLLPLHVVLLELLIDPACSLVFEAEPATEDLMKKPPRKASARLITASAAFQAVGIGGLALLGMSVIQWAARQAGADTGELRLASLCSILVANLLMLSWFRKSSRHAPANQMFHVLVIGVCVVMALLLGLPAAGALLSLPESKPLAWVVLALLPGCWSGWRILSARRQQAADAHAQQPMT